MLEVHDLIHLGTTAGPSLGQLAEELYTARIEGALKTPTQAEKWAGKWLKKHEISE